ncbi:MAG: hypothetical protein HY459_00830 [Parcubacteria group bacterium]|nr:hypothetical protein [Parcubacteria group bacterium]
MSFILQMQRRAIESLRDHAHEFPRIDPRAELILNDGTPLEILGISQGVGTCSEIHGMNVLVVGTEPLHAARAAAMSRTLLDCAYTVLLRGPTVQEVEEERNRHLWGDGHAFACVELLRSITRKNHRIILTRTGRKRLYVALA